MPINPYESPKAPESKASKNTEPSKLPGWIIVVGIVALAVGYLITLVMIP